MRCPVLRQSAAGTSAFCAGKGRADAGTDPAYILFVTQVVAGSTPDGLRFTNDILI